MSLNDKTQATSTQQPLRIAIVGGGPGGLTLANILQRKTQELGLDGERLPWKVIVYEAEPSSERRRQGGSLDLEHGGGLAAIAAAGLTDQFNAFARPEGQEMKIMSRVGELIFHDAGTADVASEAYRPEIDRADLNDILHEALGEDTIHWGHKLLDVRQEYAGDYTLRFANGETVSADLVVGADGAWSRVRPLVTSAKPIYSGVPLLDWLIKDFDNRFPDLVELVGQGTCFGYGQGKLLIAQRNGYGVLRLYLGFKAEADWGKTSDIALALSEPERARMLVDTLYKDWDETLKQLIMAAGETLDGVESDQGSKMAVRSLHALPTGIKWANRKGVTLVGDAAHVMSPFAGEGVNMAMMDALELAEAIASPLVGEDPVSSVADFKDSALAAVVEYEAKMFARVQHPMEISARTLELFLTEPECDWASAKKVFGPAIPF